MVARRLEHDRENFPVCKAIIRFTIVVYLVQLVLGMLTEGVSTFFSQLLSGSPTHVAWLLGASTAEVFHGEWYRLINATFLHGNLIHIAFNMYAMLQVGPIIERAMGPFLFLPVYILCGMAGFCVSIFADTQITVGASAGIFGLIGLGAVLAYRLGSGWRDPMFQVLFQWAAFGLLFGFVVPRIDNGAHLGGLTAGSVLGWIWVPVRQRLAFSVAAKIIAGASVLLVLASFGLCLMRTGEAWLTLFYR
jgi:rhomboid protease GluP